MFVSRRYNFAMSRLSLTGIVLALAFAGDAAEEKVRNEGGKRESHGATVCVRGERIEDHSGVPGAPRQRSVSPTS
jgi:hypothetical protein